MAARQLTERQRAVLQFLQRFVENNGYPPTIREIAEHLEVKSPNGITDHLKALERKGFILRQGYKSRGVRLVTSLDHPELGPVRPSPTVTAVPLLGRVAAGEPIPALESADVHLHIDNTLLGRERRVFALKIRGDSMIEAGIMSDDLVLVAPRQDARSGEIVVVRIDGDATCKYYHPDLANDRVVLRPANPRMADIIVTAAQYRDTVMVGKVIGLIRRYN